MAYIIDGHNLIGVLPDIQLNQPDDESRLLDKLRSHRAHRGGGEMIVFFDSGPSGAGSVSPVTRPGLVSTPGVDVRFSGQNQSADDAIVPFIRQRGRGLRLNSGALVAMETDGAVRAMVGGPDYGESQFNRATKAKRQPGSAFKPFLYLAAIEQALVVAGPLNTILDGGDSQRVVQVGAAAAVTISDLTIRNGFSNI